MSRTSRPHPDPLPLAGEGAAQFRRPRGAAVVLAMLLAALAATIAVTLFADQQRWTRAVMQRRDQVQAQALAMAGVQWARQILDTGGRPKTVDHLGEPWAMSLPPIPLDNGEIRGLISDASARLNVNGLGVAAAPAIRSASASSACSRSAAGRSARSTRSPTGSMSTATGGRTAPRMRPTPSSRRRASPPTAPSYAWRSSPPSAACRWHRSRPWRRT